MPDVPLSEVAALARRNDPDRFLCALFAPAEARETLFLLTAFNHELARARTATTNIMTALIRLQWWRDALGEVAAGNPVRRHEVTTPLAEASRAGKLAVPELLAMIDAREAEIEEEVPSKEALMAFLRGSSGGYAVAAGRVLGAPPAAMPGLQAAGSVYGMALLLRDIAATAMQGRCLLPVDMLEERGLLPADVVRDPRNPAVAEIGRALAQQALQLWAEARPGLGKALPRHAVAAALPVRLGVRDLRRILGKGWDPGQPPPPRGTRDRLSVTWAGWRGKV